jgi:hypothetical protein
MATTNYSSTILFRIHLGDGPDILYLILTTDCPPKMWRRSKIVTAECFVHTTDYILIISTAPQLLRLKLQGHLRFACINHTLQYRAHRLLYQLTQTIHIICIFLVYRNTAKN